MLPQKVNKKRGLTSELCEQYNLDAVSQRFIRHLLLFPDARLKDLSEITGLTVQACSQRLQRPNMRAALAELSGTTNEHLAKAQRIGAMRLARIAEGGQDKDAIEAVKVAAVIGSTALQDTGENYRKLPSAEDAEKILAEDPANQVVEITPEDLIFDD